jgi:hypothetical protein
MKPVLASLIAVAAFLSVAGLVSADPDPDKNPNVQVLPFDCGSLGSFDIIKPDNSAAAFSSQGHLVVKRLAGEITGTLTTFDGEVFGPVHDVFASGAQGKGFEERLVPCTVEETFTDSFTLDAETAALFGVPDEYVGTLVTVNGTLEATASIVSPGAE